MSITAETLDFLYQYFVEHCMSSEVELKQLSSSSNYIESFHYFNYKISVMFGIRLRIMFARILEFITTRSGCYTASCCTMIFASHGESHMGLTFRLSVMKGCAVLCCLFLTVAVFFVVDVCFIAFVFDSPYIRNITVFWTWMFPPFFIVFISSSPLCSDLLSHFIGSISQFCM